ncbi:MAG TPA: T9SS type A sorting domain-containing protein [Chitinophagaceae bacterium]
MKKNLFVVSILVLAVAGTYFLLRSYSTSKMAIEIMEEKEEEEARFTDMRVKYEFDMVKDPVTGKIPSRIYEQELAQARAIPEKGSNTSARLTALNTYFPAGPNNQGGRTRAIAYDVRYNGSTNRVIMAGGVSGGIFRSTDGGANWTRVSPEGEVHNISTLAQDPRPTFQDTWYAGGGEYLGSSTDEIGAPYFAFGLFKSTDNGATWTRLPLAATDINGANLPAGALETFDNPFDYTHKLIVNPANGDVYAAVHRRLLRSTNGGTSFTAVFANPTATAFASNGQMDVVCSSTGKLVLAVSGANPDFNLRGVWTSATGNANSWTRIAGGSVLGTDSVANWRANSFKYDLVNGSNLYESKRILLAMAPSNQNIVYVTYENGLTNVAPDNAPEADLFKLDMTGGVNTWSNRSANMPDFPGGNHAATDPFAIQGGYDFFITVKPDDPNFVLLGGTSLYRSTDGFSTANYNTTLSWIGGYGNSLPTLSFYLNSHPDIHCVAFHPTNFNEVICANDGGIQMTSNITATGSTVAWTNLSNYQTLQYYNVSMDPGAGRNNFLGGAQDNGTYFRDKMQLLGTIAADSNNHIRVLGGDGGHSGMGPLSSNEQYLYASFHLGNLRRFKLSATPATDNITPTNLTTTGTAGEFGDFVTNIRLDPDNTEDLYYVNFNRLFRTTNASTVTSSTWTELTAVGTTLDPDGATNGYNTIRGMAISRGPYATSHALYLGTTSGRIYRIDNPRNVSSSSAPVNITPPGNTGNVQDIAINPNNDDEILAIISSYGVISLWWTNNAKSASPTWRNAEGNLTLPSFRSAAIIVKKDAANNPVTEYYVGTSVGLYSTVNLGATLLASASPTWQREGGNVLNFAVIQSIAYRPVDNVLVMGTHGNGMYYTFLGTPNFVPNQNTGTNDPTVNDKNFIKTVFPTLTDGNINYRIGNMLSVRKISLQVFNVSGQLLLQKETGYQDGTVDITKLSKGVYILSIYSDDRKYRHLQKIVKE